MTGISFTDPVALRDICGIKNNLGTKRELSSKFIYRFVNEMGGPEKFYKNYFISAMFPLALLKGGKNHNYYDSTSLYKSLKPCIVDALTKQIRFGANRKLAVSLGKKNFDYLQEINDEYGFFKEVCYVEHPRYIMQYKLKLIDLYLDKYRNVLLK